MLELTGREKSMNLGVQILAYKVLQSRLPARAIMEKQGEPAF